MMSLQDLLRFRSRRSGK